MAGVRRVAIAGASIWLATALILPAAGAPGDVVTLSDPVLTNSAALAADTARGLYWTAPASPDSGVVHAVDATGQLAGEVHFDTRPTTVEGAAVFNGLLYLGDLGDPHAARPSVRVIRLESLELGGNVPFSEWELIYPDGPQDAKTLMVSPRGNLWVVSHSNPGRLYFAQAPATGYGQIHLEFAAEVPAWVTDGTFIDGSTAVLRTYNGVYTIDMNSYVVKAIEALPAQPEGESVTTALDGAGLMVGSIADDRLLGVAMPTGWVDLPVQADPPGPLPEPEPVPETEPTATPAEPTTPEPTTAPEPGGAQKIFASRKALLAIGLAAVASVAAGSLAYFGRSRAGSRPAGSRRRT